MKSSIIRVLRPGAIKSAWDGRPHPVGLEIARISHEHLRAMENKLITTLSDTAIQTRRALHQKSTDVFMWVVLVMQIQNKAYNRDRTHILQQNLRGIPGDLRNLFRNMLTRHTVQGDKLLLLIQ